MVWEDGSRAWIPYSRLCPDADDRLLCALMNPEDFVPADDFVLAPKEHGRGWLPHPPARSAPRPIRSELCQLVEDED